MVELQCVHTETMDPDNVFLQYMMLVKFTCKFLNYKTTRVKY